MSHIKSERKLYWAVDSLVVRDGTFFGHGWVFHAEIEVWDVRLKVKFSDNESQLIDASYGKPRDDVADSFPSSHTARHSGFFLLGCGNRGAAKLSELYLQVTLGDGSLVELRVPQNNIRSFGAVEQALGGVSFGQLTAAAKRGIHLLRRFEIAGLVARVERFFSNRPSRHLADAEAIKTLLYENELRDVVLVIDHDLGGGANQYRKRLVEEKIASGATVFILSFSLTTLSYILIVRTQRLNSRYVISGPEFLLDFPDQLQFSEIVYNTGVSFMRPENLPPLIMKLKERYSARLLLLVHDFFMVCPSHYLIDDTGVHCGIPNMERCQTCLANNRQDFSSLYRLRDMSQWRASWGCVIVLADEVKTFSENSRSLLQRAYPELKSAQVTVKPHAVTYLQHDKIQPTDTTTLKIGVVGQIGYHKGAMVVRELAHEIKSRGLAVKIVMIGSIETSCDPDVVSETGPYQHEKLAELIESARVNIMLFPSIWPETFSFVVQELIELGMSVACFDMGAPAERLRNYDKGMVLESTSASAVLDGLILFHRRMYLAGRA